MKEALVEYTPDNYKEYLGNDLYHHKDKGCELEIKINKSSNGNISIEKFCKTHNVLCSKTGWELGWYNGTESKKIGGQFTCQRCGETFNATEAWRNFCDKCKKETIYRICEDCGGDAKRMFYCWECKKVSEIKCKEHETGKNYYRRKNK
jgi:hypothetical protein